MYKSKARAGWLAAALCMIILTACGKPQAEETNLIDISNVVASETSFRTTTVRRGTYAEESQTSGVVRFPFSSDLEWDRPGCRIEEICVQRGDHVAEGDVLIRFTSEESLLDLEEMQLKLDRLKEMQRAILENLSHYVRPGGMLIYSTCSVLTEEDEPQVLAFLDSHSEFRLSSVTMEGFRCENGMLRSWPQENGNDGFFAAKLIRQDTL